MSASSVRIRRARPLLGTLVEIRVPSAGEAATRAVDRAFRAIERVHRAMSAQESTSDIARLRAGRHAGLDPWTRRVLERAEEVRLASDVSERLTSTDGSNDDHHGERAQPQAGHQRPPAARTNHTLRTSVSCEP